MLIFSFCAQSTILGVRIQAAQSSVGKVLSSWVIFPPMVGLLLHDIHLETRVRDIQGGLDAGDTAADDQRPLDNRAFARRQGRVQMHLGNGGLAEDNGLFGGLVGISL